MEQSKLSEKEILELGKKIVSELNLESNGNTTQLWMAHYIAELMHRIEKEESIKEKDSLKRECCDVILSLWSSRDRLNDLSPLTGLEPLIELLNELKKDEFSYPYWRANFGRSNKDTNWRKFGQGIRSYSESIFELCLYSSVSKPLLEYKKDWLNKYKSTLEEEELQILDSMNVLINRGESMIRFSGDKAKDVDIWSKSVSERYAIILNKIEEKLNKQNELFQNLKKHTLR